jgi:hypothetical protein
VVLLLIVACVPFLFEISEVICELNLTYARVAISGNLQLPSVHGIRS